MQYLSIIVEYPLIGRFFYFKNKKKFLANIKSVETIREMPFMGKEIVQKENPWLRLTGSIPVFGRI